MGRPFRKTVTACVFATAGGCATYNAVAHNTPLYWAVFAAVVILVIDGVWTLHD